MYRKNNDSWLKHWDFILIDIICIEIAFFGAYFIRHIDEYVFNTELYIQLGILLVVFDLIAILINNSYSGIIQRMKWPEMVSVVKHVTITEVLLLLYEYVMKETEELSRAVFLLSWGLAIVLCWGTRLVWKKMIRVNMLKRENQSNMLVISTADHVCTCIEELRGKIYRGFEISGVAIIDDISEITSDLDLKIRKMSLGKEISFIRGKEELTEYVRQDIVDEVYIDTFKDKADLEKLVQMFLQMGVTVHIGMEFLPANLPNRFLESIGECNAVTTTIKTASALELTLKRIMDIAGGLVGIILTGIAYVFVAPVIKKESPGPVFFKQERVGKNGRIFFIYKFRSMYLDAEERKKELMKHNEMQGFMFKMENDPRIIGSEKGPGKGIGNFIRKTSIDELPQFWNILKGDMSLVGTRPPTKNEYEQYDLHHKIRLSMKPGLTGMWQTSGRSEITDFEEVVKLDTKYIENWSLWLDIKLIFKTIKVVLDRKGSK